MSYHMREIGGYLKRVGYICYHGNNQVMMMDNWRPGVMMIEKQQGMEVLGAYLSPPVSIKDRSLTALLSCRTHAPHLAGRISHFDREA